MKFVYKAKKGLNEIVKGVVDAPSHQEAVSQLCSQGLHPITVEREALHKEKEKRPLSPFRIKVFRRKVTSRQAIVFTQKLTTLIRAKVELLPALKIIYEQTESEALRKIVFEMYNFTREGKAFSESLRRYPEVFFPLYVNLIKAGEASGNLSASLEQISEFLFREDAIKTKVAVALAYPGLLLTVGMVSIFILINFVIPKLKPMFDNMGQDLPLITKIVLNLSEASNKSWWIILGAIAVFIAFLYQQKGKLYFKRLIRRIKVNVPIVKKVIRNQELAYFSRSFSLLLKSGVPALRSLEVVIPGIEDPRLNKELKKVLEQVSTGKSLSRSMESLTSLPKFFSKMIAVGEESGMLSGVLEEISRSYTQQVESDISLMSSLLEPILILLLGLVLGTIVLAILIPTFQITQMVQ